MLIIKKKGPMDDIIEKKLYNFIHFSSNSMPVAVNSWPMRAWGEICMQHSCNFFPLIFCLFFYFTLICFLFFAFWGRVVFCFRFFIQTLLRISSRTSSNVSKYNFIIVLFCTKIFSLSCTEIFSRKQQNLFFTQSWSCWVHSLIN